MIDHLSDPDLCPHCGLFLQAPGVEGDQCGGHECKNLPACTGKYHRERACACGAPANYDGEFP